MHIAQCCTSIQVHHRWSWCYAYIVSTGKPKNTVHCWNTTNRSGNVLRSWQPLSENHAYKRQRQTLTDSIFCMHSFWSCVFFAFFTFAQYLTCRVKVQCHSIMSKVWSNYIWCGCDLYKYTYNTYHQQFMFCYRFIIHIHTKKQRKHFRTR